MKKKPDIWDKIDQLITEDNRPLQPDEFTLPQLMDRMRQNGQALPETTLLRKLKKLISDGVMTKRKTIHKGFQVNAYRFL